MFAPRKPDASEARKELVGNLTVFALSIAAIRATTYVLEAIQKRD